ncbi:MAG: T9SS type A sorting domain-containing protein [bacterium]
MIKTPTFLLLFAVSLPLITQGQVFTPSSVQKPVYFDVSPPLRDMMKLDESTMETSWKNGVVQNGVNFKDPKSPNGPITPFADPGLQNYFGPLATDTTIQNFEGLGGGSFIPPDTDGEIGPNHYFQVVNCSFAIYNKTGSKILGPMANSSVWSGMPNNSNDGDAVILYDEVADRWMFSQFSLPNFPNGPFFQMIAISQTPDPTGSWYRYQYQFTDMPDYPKFGIWKDGYYMSCNRFSAGATHYIGTGAAAFDRDKMLVGDPGAEIVYFTLPGSNDAYSLLPADCDGLFPPAGTPNYFTYLFYQSSYYLGILEFNVNWETPGSSTFGNLTSLTVNSFDPDLRPGISQKGTSVKLATLSDRLMFRLQFRKFNDHWSMVCNHSVNTGSNVAGIRWYELRKTTGAWEVYQQGTYSPDSHSRWMGSMAMDSAGNIAIGYSVSSSSLYPSIRYCGRLSGDPLNQMTVNERRIIDGGGCQTSSSSRWGDYSGMRVDASCPTTFWYTTEYYSTTAASSWQTRVASFSFTNEYSVYATANPLKICQNDSSQLFAMAYGGSGTYTYSWSSIPAGFTSGLKDPKVAPMDTTQYIVAVNDGSQTKYDTLQVKVIFKPSGSAGADTLVCEHEVSIDLHGVASNYKSIGWSSTGNGVFSSQTSLNTTYTFGSHDYDVDSVNLQLHVFAISPCTGKVVGTRHITLDPCTGIGETAAGEPELIIEPNPATQSSKMVVTGIQERSVSFSMTNMKGQILLSEEIRTTGSTATKILDLAKYPAGVYFIKVRTDKKMIIKQLVIY